MNMRGELTLWVFLLWLLSVLPMPSAAIPFGLIAALTPLALIVVARKSMGWRDGIIPTGLVLLTAVGAMWLGRGSVESGPWILGMPLVTAALIFGIWLVPQLLIVTGYVRAFDESAFELASLRSLQIDSNVSGVSRDGAPNDTEQSLPHHDGSSGAVLGSAPRDRVQQTRSSSSKDQSPPGAERRTPESSSTPSSSTPTVDSNDEPTP